MNKVNEIWLQKWSERTEINASVCLNNLNNVKLNSNRNFTKYLVQIEFTVYYKKK